MAVNRAMASQGRRRRAQTGKKPPPVGKLLRKVGSKFKEAAERGGERPKRRHTGPIGRPGTFGSKGARLGAPPKRRAAPRISEIAGGAKPQARSTATTAQDFADVGYGTAAPAAAATPPAKTPLVGFPGPGFAGDSGPTFDPNQPGQLERDYEFGNITPPTPGIDTPLPGAAPGQMVPDPAYMPPPTGLSEQEIDDLVTSVTAKQEAQRTAAPAVPRSPEPIPQAPAEDITSSLLGPEVKAAIAAGSPAPGAAPVNPLTQHRASLPQGADKPYQFGRDFGASLTGGLGDSDVNPFDPSAQDVEALAALPPIEAPDLPPSPMSPFDELALGGGQTGGQFGPSPYMEVPRDPYRHQEAARAGYDYGSAFGKTADINALEDFYMEKGRVNPDEAGLSREHNLQRRRGIAGQGEGRINPAEAGLSREEILQRRQDESLGLLGQGVGRVNPDEAGLSREEILWRRKGLAGQGEGRVNPAEAGLSREQILQRRDRGLAGQGVGRVRPDEAGLSREQILQRRQYKNLGILDQGVGRVNPAEAGLSRGQILRRRMANPALQEIYGR